MKRIMAMVLAFVALIGAYYLWSVPQAGGQGLALIHTSIGFFTPYTDLRERIKTLETENNDLKNRIFNESMRSGASAKVYSSYPFNQRCDIVIDEGSAEGILMGAYVTYGETALIGRVKEVREHTSVVETVFGSEWEMSVRIGEKEIDGLFHGGNTLIVDLIPKEAEVKEGDIIVTASSEFPYGLEVGHVGSIEEMLGEPFKKVTVIPPVRLGELRNVEIHG